jgi:hypothetical protein
MAKIRNLQFNELVEGIISKTTRFDSSALSYDFPLHHDIDLLNQERRKTLYRVQRDLLLKLAKASSGVFNSSAFGHPVKKMDNSKYVVTWDMSKDYSQEWVPNEIIHCVRMAKLAEKGRLTVLPMFD